MSEETPVSLLQRLRAPGDPAAWDRFVGLYVPLLRRWAGRLGAAGPEADDLVQDVLVTLVRALPDFQYDPARRFRGWLWTVTANRWREAHRRARPGVSPAGLPDVPVPDPTEAVDEAEYRRYVVGRALALMRAEFQPTTWQAFLDTTTGDGPAADVAARLGLTVAAVYAARSRVLRRLRQELDGLIEWD